MTAKRETIASLKEDLENQRKNFELEINALKSEVGISSIIEAKDCDIRKAVNRANDLAAQLSDAEGRIKDLECQLNEFRIQGGSMTVI